VLQKAEQKQEGLTDAQGRRGATGADTRASGERSEAWKLAGWTPGLRME
jgi:hypothetical protein